MKKNGNNVFLIAVLMVFTVVLKPHKNLLKLIKLLCRGLAVAIAGFLSYKIAPLLPGAALEVVGGLVPGFMLLVTLSYLLLMFAASLSFWQGADHCTIQLKNRFNIEP